MYEKLTHDNDYIILKLGSPLQFNENVQPACLPSSSSFLDLDSTKTTCFTSGWGKLDFSKLQLNKLLVLVLVHCSCFFGRNNFSSMYLYVNHDKRYVVYTQRVLGITYSKNQKLMMPYNMSMLTFQIMNRFQNFAAM